MQFICVPKKAGEKCLAPELFSRAWDECIESHIMDKETWIRQAIRIVESVPRYEMGFIIDGKPIGGISLTVDYDPHVGECLCVMSQYVLPEYRNNAISMRCMRECLKLTKQLGHSVLAYTHRQKDWVYTTTYKVIK